jgi:hypothetical protein
MELLMTPRLAFKRQREGAAERGIKFKFTYEQWVAWWEAHLGPDWMQKRGCRRGQFVMARKGDKGPYAAWNVQCVLQAENQRQRVDNGTSTYGERHSNSKLTEQDVIYIRTCGKRVADLVREFGISQPSIVQARNGTRWAYLNEKYPPPVIFIK